MGHRLNLLRVCQEASGVTSLTLSTDNSIVAESLHGEELAIQDGQHLRGGKMGWGHCVLCVVYNIMYYSAYVHTGLEAKVDIMPVFIQIKIRCVFVCVLQKKHL